jgi:hypothetical protein
MDLRESGGGREERRVEKPREEAGKRTPAARD